MAKERKVSLQVAENKRKEEEVILLAKKIEDILVHRVGIKKLNFDSRQGSGASRVLKIVVSQGNESAIKIAENCLTTELGLTLKPIGKHGVGGRRNTLLVPLRGIEVGILAKIEKESQLLLNLSKKVKAKTEETASVETEKEVLPVVVTDSPAKEEICEAGCKLALSRFLNPFMREEGIPVRSFSFNIDKNRVATFTCESEEVAKMIERVISFQNSSCDQGSNFVVRIEKEVAVNCVEFLGMERKPFAFPPRRDEPETSVIKKIQRVYRTTFRIISASEGGITLIFERKQSAEKALSVLTNLGWDIHRSVTPVFLFVRYEETVPSTPTVITEAPVEVAVPIVPAEAVKITAPEVSTHSASETEREGILRELRRLVVDPSISLETKEQIQRVLYPEDYAKKLLARLGEI